MTHPHPNFTLPTPSSHPNYSYAPLSPSTLPRPSQLASSTPSPLPARTRRPRVTADRRARRAPQSSTAVKLNQQLLRERVSLAAQRERLGRARLPGGSVEDSSTLARAHLARVGRRQRAAAWRRERRLVELHEERAQADRVRAQLQRAGGVGDVSRERAAAVLRYRRRDGGPLVESRGVPGKHTTQAPVEHEQPQDFNFLDTWRPSEELLVRLSREEDAVHMDESHWRQLQRDEDQARTRELLRKLRSNQIAPKVLGGYTPRKRRARSQQHRALADLASRDQTQREYNPRWEGVAKVPPLRLDKAKQGEGAVQRQPQSVRARRQRRAPRRARRAQTSREAFKSIEFQPVPSDTSRLLTETWQEPRAVRWRRKREKAQPKRMQLDVQVPAPSPPQRQREQDELAQVAKSMSIGNPVSKLHGFLTQQNVGEMLRESGYSRRELYIMFVRFKALCALSPSPDGIDKETFKHGVSRLSVEDDLFVDRVFDLVDEDGSGQIEWDEFRMAMSALERGSMDVKNRFCLNVYDLDEDGMIGRQDLSIMFKSSSMLPDDETASGSTTTDAVVSTFVNRVFSTLGVDGDYITLDDITRYMRTRPPSEDVWDIFGRSMLRDFDQPA